MRRVSFFLIAAALFLAGCATDIGESNDVEMTYEYEESEGSTLDELIPNTKSETFTISKAKEMLSIGEGVGSVTLNNVKGKSVYVISQNNTKKTINTARAMTIASLAATGRAAVKKQADMSDSEIELEDYNGFSNVAQFPINAANVGVKASGRAAGGSFSMGPTPHVGSQKSIFVDSNEALTKFTRKKAKVEYEGKHCYIWSIEDDKILDSVSCKNLADTFDEYYMEMRSIFGQESDKIYIYNSGFKLEDMRKHADTGTKVNIVVYSISNPTTIGYFHSKDYYETEDELEALTGSIYSENSATKFSNGGKYFYMNYRYASGSFLEKALATSTLLHEFQHMIHFSVKNMAGLKPSAWYNEMLSMLAEDIFATRLNTGSKAPSVMRMGSFSRNYFKSGLTDFSNSYAYGTSYSFGGWLVRNFGGVNLVHVMMTNNKVDEDSIVAAVNTFSPKKYDFDALFNEYVSDCVNSKNFNIKLNGVADVNEKSYTLNPITNTPIVTPVDKSLGADLGPYGFVVRQVEVTGSSCTFELSERTSREKVHIIVK